MNIAPYLLAALIPVLGTLPGSKASSTLPVWLEWPLRYDMGLVLALMTYMVVIHQIHVDGLIGGMAGYGEPGSDVWQFREDFYDLVGSASRTFGHGA